jgi:hypothetical protein
MFLNRVKTVALAVLFIGTATAGVGVWARWTPVAAGQPIQSENASPLESSTEFQRHASDSPQAVTTKSVVSENPASSKNSTNVSPPLVNSIPDGQRVFPLSSRDVIALAYVGKATIRTIAAYSAETGEWSTIDLVNPVQGEVTPIVGTDSALYQVGNDFYAFSAVAGKWDVLRLPATPKAIGTISEKFIKVRQADHLYVFGVKPARWSKGVTVTTGITGATKGNRPNQVPAE